MTGGEQATLPLSDPRTRLVLLAFGLADAAIIVDSSLYFRLIGARLSPLVLGVVVLGHTATVCRWISGAFTERKSTRRNAFILWFSSVPAGGLAGGWAFLLGASGGLEELAAMTTDIIVLVASCAAGYFGWKWTKGVVNEVRRVRRTNGSDRLLLLQVYRGCRTLSIGMLCCRWLINSIAPLRYRLDLWALFFWLGAAIFFVLAVGRIGERPGKSAP